MPAIDISQLATLDEHGVDVAGRPPPQAFAQPPQAFAPPPQAFAPSPQAFAPPPQVFAPPSPGAFAPPPDAFGPGDDDQSIGVERSTRAIRIENEWQLQREVKQAAAAAPPPAPRRQIGGVVLAIGLIAAVAIALAMIAMQPKEPRAVAPRPGLAAQPASR
jgi:hypothetical protein